MLKILSHHFNPGYSAGQEVATRDPDFARFCYEAGGRVAMLEANEGDITAQYLWLMGFIIGFLNKRDPDDTTIVDWMLWHAARQYDAHKLFDGIEPVIEPKATSLTRLRNILIEGYILLLTEEKEHAQKHQKSTG